MRGARKATSKRNQPGGLQGGLAFGQGAVAGKEKRAPKGVKLKTVSTFTMAFALGCLGAFMAGRPPVSAFGSDSRASVIEEGARRQTQRNAGALGEDDARSFLGSGVRKREAGAKEIEKSARARAAVGLLLAHTKQKDD